MDLHPLYIALLSTLFWRDREIFARQIYLIVRQDLWEPFGAKTIGDDSRFVVVCSVICGTLLPSGRGAHLLYWRDVWNLLLGQSFLNMGSVNFNFHDVMSRQGSAIKYTE